jgi:adenylate kinase
MDASRTGKRLAGKTALVITAVQGIGTASVLTIVKKITVLLLCLAFGKSAFTRRQAHIIDGGCSD